MIAFIAYTKVGGQLCNHILICKNKLTLQILFRLKYPIIKAFIQITYISLHSTGCLYILE